MTTKVATMQPSETSNEQQIKSEALSLVQRVSLVRIVDQESYNIATDLLLNEIKPFRKKWEEYWSGIKGPAYQAYQAILAKFNEGDKPLAAMELAVKNEIRRFDDEQQRIQQ